MSTIFGGVISGFFWNGAPILVHRFHQRPWLPRSSARFPYPIPWWPDRRVRVRGAADLAYCERVRRGAMRSFEDLREAVTHGAVQRVRPKLMTVTTTFVALLPIMWSTGAGADVMKRIAAPMVGGLFTSFLMELMVYPAVYTIWKWRFEMRSGQSVPTGG